MEKQNKSNLIESEELFKNDNNPIREQEARLDNYTLKTPLVNTQIKSVSSPISTSNLSYDIPSDKVVLESSK